ncbi:MAG: LapA family protein [Stigonema ocellatum SAG 48.90 = DSM 106950]|nr:LapA family protein [Stigonema ocellatum SAG 48.90 = DSM 106950]
MPVIRLILLVAVLGTLTLLLVQNWSPVLALKFLGMQTQPLPLAMWILFSTAAGGVTSLLITSLFKLSNYFTAPQRQTPLKSPATSPPTANRRRREEPTPPQEADDDWDSNSTKNDDWDFEENKSVDSTSSPQNTQVRDSNTYERPQEPKSTSGSGSVYSYSYQEPKNSGVGKTESVYDADYRVIVPPYQPPTTKDADDDDWGFFDDDDSEDKKDKQDKRSRK